MRNPENDNLITAIVSCSKKLHESGLGKQADEIIEKIVREHSTNDSYPEFEELENWKKEFYKKNEILSK